jgi:ketosteroid isomerase-like protein
MKARETLIASYLEGYNSFDIPKMVQNFSDKIVFENIQNGEISLILNGINEFETQAEVAKSYFSERRQTIKSFEHQVDKTEVEIEYFGVLAIDLPNGMKKGQELELNGKSVFEFENEKIVRLTDIS